MNRLFTILLWLSFFVFLLTMDTTLSTERGHKPRSWLNLGMAHIQRDNDIDKAIDCFGMAIELRPYYVPAWSNLSVCYRVKGNREMALECYKMAQYSLQYEKVWEDLQLGKDVMEFNKKAIQ